MDQAAALMAALEAAAKLGDDELDPTRVEALAGALGLERQILLALIDQLETAGKVALRYGGVVKVPLEQTAGAGVVFNMQGASFGPGATFAGRDAHGATVHTTPEEAFGTMAAVLTKLQAVRPNLQDEAATAADRTIEVLKGRPAAEAPEEARRNWAREAKIWLARLLAAAPQVKDAVELGEDVVKGLGWN
jgi:hypothetical protein